MRNIIIIINKYRRKLIIEYIRFNVSEKIYVLSSGLMGPIVEKEEHLELI